MKTLIMVANAVAALLAAGIGSAANDQGSFGRDVTYLDLSSAPFSVFAYTAGTSCQGFPSTAKCSFITSPTTVTTFSETNVARVQLPAYSTNSLLCMSLSPNIISMFSNASASNARASFVIVVDSVIESIVLNNPALINKVTGQPFNGRITATMWRHIDQFTLLPNDTEVKAWMNSRHCVSGVISTSLLQNMYGLTASQARAVFASPITVSLDYKLTLLNADNVTVQVPFRLYGD